ncbi:unnamed protein product [Urochloa decumbens]|uniref:DUF4220 domain-containing protein n=1 Tax=Urochloa decumbens TaxID=240449 RepID=A0ABC9AIJ7_9POAL
MSFAQSVRWWEEWQLRFLVLASLAFQYFLFAAALLRKRRIPHWFRALVWLAYQGGDIVAVYALATLFNRHKKDEMAAGGSSGGGGAHLDILWAPVLLLHLGGQDGITAYSIEDNENWRRHLLVAASQITVAIYVFCKSWWFHDGRLLRASILLFVPGVFKCLEKPWALWNATVASIANSSDPQMTLTFEEDDDRTLPTDTDDMDSLDKYVTAARGCVDKEARRETPLFFDDKMNNDEPYHLFVDLARPYYIRLKNLQVMAAAKGTGKAEAHGRARVDVSRAFDRLYTKHMASYGGVLRAVVVIVTLAVVGLFRRRGEKSLPYARADVVVTYVLLCFTAALELISTAVVLGSGLPETDDKLSQYNLLTYLSRNRRRRWLRHAALLVGLKDQLDWLWPTALPVPSRRVTELVHDHVASGWKGVLTVGDYRRFNDSRGQRTLESAGLVATAGGGVGGGTATAVERSLRMPFDESVVVWHLATELCYFDHVDVGGGSVTWHGRAISDYMAYLLFVKPWMLTPRARRKLFHAEEDEEYEETERWKKAKPRAMDEIARKIIRKLRDPPTATSSGGAWSPARRLSVGLVRIAWELSYELLEFGKGKVEEFVNEEGKKKQLAEEEKKKASAAAVEPEKKQLTAEEKKRKEEEEKKEEARKKESLANRARKHGDERMWEVIQGVWVEMLCFSAGRSSGYLHAKSLAKGGEYLTYV